MGAGFASGDRFVVGVWEKSPLGPMADVMWAQGDGTRTLLAPDDAVGRFVSDLYSFEKVDVVPFHLHEKSDRLHLEAGPLELDLMAGSPYKVFTLRPRLLRRSPAWCRVEDVIFRPVLERLLLKDATGTRAYGIARSGARQWYCVDAYRPVTRGRGRLEGIDLGALSTLEPPAGFGFSEFPVRPAFVSCAPVIEMPCRLTGLG